MAPSNFLLFLLATATTLITGQLSDYPTANLSTLWTNNNASLKHSITYIDGSVVRAIVLRSPKTIFGPSFAAGFFCPTAPCDTGAFLFAVFIVYTNSGAGITSVVNGIPQVVWSANRIHPVKENATLELTGDGNLILRDADGALIWSSSTAGRSIAGMTITELGSLVLFDQKNATVWQSFDHPTDALVPGQSLLEGMRLTANTSATNWTQNQLYITVLHDGLYAYVDSTPPQLYFSRLVTTDLVKENKTGNHPTQFTLTNGSFSIFVQSTPDPYSSITLPAAKSTQYMRFESDGHLRLYEWSDAEAKWVMVYDVIKMFPDDDCAFPTVCGEYGVCTGGQCSCPFQTNSTSSYFRLINGWKPNIGCMPLTPISSRCSLAPPLLQQQDKVIQMMKLAMWCLHHDSSRRPLMSTVVKVLEGTMTVETSIDYNFFSSDPVLSVQGDQSAYSAPPLASVLSSDFYFGCMFQIASEE